MNLNEFKTAYQNQIFIIVTYDDQTETHIFNGMEDLKRYIFLDKEMRENLFKIMSIEKGSEFNYKDFSGDIEILEASLYEKCSREACIRTVLRGSRGLTLDVNQLTQEFWPYLLDKASLLYAGFSNPNEVYTQVYTLINSEA